MDAAPLSAQSGAHRADRAHGGRCSSPPDRI